MVFVRKLETKNHEKVGGRRVLKWIWTGLNWLWLGASGGLLLIWYFKLRVP
jgi:hypothetical protein